MSHLPLLFAGGIFNTELTDTRDINVKRAFDCHWFDSRDVRGI